MKGRAKRPPSSGFATFSPRKKTRGEKDSRLKALVNCAVVAMTQI